MRVTATPRPLAREVCNEAYVVNFTVETDAVSGPLLDLFRSYDIADWRLHETGARIRHELGIIWDPYRDVDTYQPERTRYASKAAEPLIVDVCPAESGRMMACSDTRCEVIGDASDAPPVFLELQDEVFELPWEPDEIQELREGDVLDVDVNYTMRTGSRTVAILLDRSPNGPPTWRGLASSREFRITPRRAPVSPGAGTVRFRILAVRDELAQRPSIESFYFSPSSGSGHSAGCSVMPKPLLVRVAD